MKIKLRSVYDSFPEKYGKSDKQINFYVDNNVYYMDNTDRNEEEAIAMAIVEYVRGVNQGGSNV